MSTVHTSQQPKAGDILVCEKSGMTLAVTEDCQCQAGARLECRGRGTLIEPADAPAAGTREEGRKAARRRNECL
ncbi:MAG TPA: hypothetical protein VMV10_01790 [Pirellulales bacterium]|nr:hypothetical protein [Pirellulales bacterium]